MAKRGRLLKPSDLEGYEPEQKVEADPKVVGVATGKWDWEKALIARGRAEGMKPTSQHIALLLSVYADGDGTSIRPTIETLVKVSGRSKATVQESLRSLRNTGWVHQVSRGSGAARKASEYRLTVPPKVQ